MVTHKVYTNTNCKPWYNITNTNVNPTLLVFLVKNLGDYGFTVLQLLSLTK